MKNLKYITLILSSFILFSCETVVTDDIETPNSTPLLVVEGGVERYNQGESTITQITLSTTNSFLDQSSTPRVENAEVSITVNDQKFDLQNKGDGLFESDEIIASIGQTYVLDIQWNGYQYTASDFMNEVPPIDAFYSVFEEESIFADEGYFVNFDYQDPPGVPNQYHFRVYKNGEYVSIPDPGNSRSVISTDEFYDGAFRSEVSPNEEAVFVPGDEAGVDLMGISLAYFDYLFLIYETTGSQGSFIGNPPPASVRGNIIAKSSDTPRALGYFHVADISRRETIVTP